MEQSLLEIQTTSNLDRLIEDLEVIIHIVINITLKKNKRPTDLNVKLFSNELKYQRCKLNALYKRHKRNREITKYQTAYKKIKVQNIN